MIYHRCEIEALPEHDPKTHQWLISLKISKREHGRMVSRLFSLTESYPTEKEAIIRCWDYGQKLIDGEIFGLSNDNR
jgi:hypothetical protein